MWTSKYVRIFSWIQLKIWQTNSQIYSNTSTNLDEMSAENHHLLLHIEKCSLLCAIFADFQTIFYLVFQWVTRIIHMQMLCFNLCSSYRFILPSCYTSVHVSVHTYLRKIQLPLTVIYTVVVGVFFNCLLFAMVCFGYVVSLQSCSIDLLDLYYP